MVGAAFHKLLLHDILSMFARFWENKRYWYRYYSWIQQHQQLPQQVSQYAGSSPETTRFMEKTVGEVHQLEDELRLSDVVKASFTK